MSNITKNYLKMLEVLSSLSIDFSIYTRVGRKPKMSDLKVLN